MLVLSASGGSVGTAEAYHSDTERQSTGAEPARRRQQQARSCSETTRRGNSHALRCVQNRNKKFILGVFLTSLPSLAFLPIFSVFPLLLRVDSQAQIQVKKFRETLLTLPAGGGRTTSVATRHVPWALNTTNMCLRPRSAFLVYKAQGTCLWWLQNIVLF